MAHGLGPHPKSKLAKLPSVRALAIQKVMLYIERYKIGLGGAGLIANEL